MLARTCLSMLQASLHPGAGMLAATKHRPRPPSPAMREDAPRTAFCAAEMAMQNSDHIMLLPPLLGGEAAAAAAWPDDTNLAKISPVEMTPHEARNWLRSRKRGV